MNEIGIYIHIPFCKQKCFYCDFNSFDDKYNRCFDYKNKLVKEINYSKCLNNYNIKSIFIGGGTPTTFPISYIDEIIYSLSKYNILDNCEITIEANPRTISKDYLKELKHIGINRLSIGLQSTDDELLKKLGRIHTYSDFYENYYNARDALFDNINLDLMFAIPDQTIEKFEQSLYEVVTLDPEHISLYSLIIEQGTIFYDLQNKLNVPDEQTDRLMYHNANRFLKQNGFNRYEISNFSKPGFESKHNLIYWHRGEYLGLGLSAHSFVNNIRFNNTNDFYEYLNKPFKHIDKIEINTSDAMEEFIFLGLRLSEGISLRKFNEQFDKDILQIYGDKLYEFQNSGFLTIEDDTIALTDIGIDVSNSIFSEILNK